MSRSFSTSQHRVAIPPAEGVEPKVETTDPIVRSVRGWAAKGRLIYAIITVVVGMLAFYGGAMWKDGHQSAQIEAMVSDAAKDVLARAKEDAVRDARIAALEQRTDGMRLRQERNNTMLEALMINQGLKSQIPPALPKGTP